MPVSSEEYVGWVHRSLNRILAERTTVTGTTSTEYRSLVKRFQGDYCPPISGLVEQRTQDAIIFANHSDPEYSTWIRQSLAKFAGAGDVGGTLGQLSKVIKKFQYSKSLDDDGWVGPNTELALYLVFGLPIPEQRASVETEDQRIWRLCGRLLQEIEWGETVILSGHARQVIPKLVMKLRTRHFNHDFFSQHNAKDFQEGWDKVKGANVPLEGTKNLARVEDVYKNNARRILEGRLRKEAPQGLPTDFVFQKFKEFVHYIYLGIDHGLWQTTYGSSTGNLKTGGTYGALMEWTEARKKNIWSVLSAWPPSYEKYWPWEQLPRF